MKIDDPKHKLAMALGGMRKSEQQVIATILKDPAAVQWMTLRDLANAAGVSEPTVLRCCRTVGAKGFTDFKVWLTQSLASQGTGLHQRVTEPVAAHEVLDRVFGAAEEELGFVRGQIDSKAMEQAAGFVAKAQRIAVFATGSSNVAAVDVFQHLNRYGLAVTHTPDLHIQTQTAATLTSQDVAIILSFTGGTQDNVRMAQLTKTAGAASIAITRPGSPLAAAADILINVAPQEDTYVFSPMSARIAQLAACDVLCTCVGLAMGGGAKDNLVKAKKSLKHLWISASEAER
ncbi:MAG: MurR/RpiR family transcriptional regulator [Henriciella sp.]